MLQEKEFVEASRAQDSGPPRTVCRHILTNMLSPLIVVATLDLTRTIILESTLSFLGLGLQPPDQSPPPAHGIMVATGTASHASPVPPVYAGLR